MTNRVDLKDLVEKFTVVAMTALDKPELIMISGLDEDNKTVYEIARGDFAHEDKMKNIETLFRMGLAIGQSTSRPVAALVVVSPEDNGLVVAGIEPDIEGEAFAAYAILLGVGNTVIEEISLNEEVGLGVRAAVQGYFSGMMGLGKRPSLDETFNPARKEQYLN